MKTSGLWRQLGVAVLAASTASDFGTPVTVLAVQILVVVDLQATATEVGLVRAAQWLPYLAFGLRQERWSTGSSVGCGCSGCATWAGR